MANLIDPNDNSNEQEPNGPNGPSSYILTINASNGTFEFKAGIFENVTVFKSEMQSVRRLTNITQSPINLTSPETQDYEAPKADVGFGELPFEINMLHFTARCRAELPAWNGTHCVKQ